MRWMHWKRLFAWGGFATWDFTGFDWPGMPWSPPEDR